MRLLSFSIFSILNLEQVDQAFLFAFFDNVARSDRNIYYSLDTDFVLLKLLCQVTSEFHAMTVKKVLINEKMRYFARCPCDSQSRSSK